MRASNADIVFDIKIISFYVKYWFTLLRWDSQRSSDYTKVAVCGIKTDLFLLLFIGFKFMYLSVKYEIKYFS